MIDIDNMSSGEWLNYREDLIDSHYARGFKLLPTVGCSKCDLENDYMCFDCECFELDKHKEVV